MRFESWDKPENDNWKKEKRKTKKLKKRSRKVKEINMNP